jgi:eukaryotic-like serine/threonine-protein kinase
VSHDLETICLKCLEKDPDRRYPSAEALAADMGRFLSGEPIAARPSSLWDRALKWIKRKPAEAVLLAIAVATAVALAAGLWSYLLNLPMQ